MIISNDNVKISIYKNMKKYKKPLLVNEQTKYLTKNKRVVFNCVSEQEAQNILEKYNYINVISPFKYNFARKRVDGNVIKIDNKHVYDNDVDFSEYSDKYFNERDKYPTIYKNISEFETVLNALVSYYAITTYNIEDSDKFEEFIDKLKLNLITKNYKQEVKNHIIEELNYIYEDMKNYDDIYILMDRLTFNKTLAIYKCFGDELMREIYEKMKNMNCVFNYTRFTHFLEMLPKMVMIRNYVYHNNSITILVRYSDIKNKVLRKNTDRTKYITLIHKLSV